jgi:hypothetical protein
MNQFNNTKYTRWYYSIIQKRAILDKDARGEIHHIIPRSMGGDDSPDNLVKLTGHDHAWCHWLLTKMTTGSAKVSMIYAFNMMGVSGEHMERQSSYAIVRAYEKNRIEWSKNHSDTMSEQFINGREIWNKGRKEDRPEVLARVKEAAQNRPKLTDEKLKEKVRKSVDTMKKNGTDKRSQETRDKQRDSMIGLVRGPMNDVHKNKIAISCRKPKSEGHGDAVAAANRGVVSINRNDVEKKVKQDTLQSWIEQGWQLGGRPRKKK